MAPILFLLNGIHPNPRLIGVGPSVYGMTPLPVGNVPTTYAVALTETGAVADTETAAAAFVGARAEAGTAADTVTASAIFAPSLTETGAVADTQAGLATFVAALTETGTAIDSIVGTSVFTGAVAEALASADSQAAAGSPVTYDVAVNEAITAAESVDGAAVSAYAVSSGGIFRPIPRPKLPSEPWAVVPEAVVPSQFAVGIRIEWLHAHEDATATVTAGVIKTEWRGHDHERAADFSVPPAIPDFDIAILAAAFQLLEEQ